MDARQGDNITTAKGADAQMDSIIAGASPEDLKAAQAAMGQ